MNNTPAFLPHLLFLILLPLFLLLLLPGGHLASALTLDCPFTYNTEDDKYSFITTAHRAGGDQINKTVYVRPQRALKVALEVDGKSSKNYAAEFLLDEDCFRGNQQWSALLMKTELRDTDPSGNQVMTTHELQVRTSTCFKQCIEMVVMEGLDSLHFWGFGASQWKFSDSENHCGHIPHWNTDTNRQEEYPWCRAINISSLSQTTPARPTPTSTTPTASATSTPNSATSIASVTPTTSTPTAIGIGVSAGGVIAGMIVVVAAIVTIVVRKRRAQPTTEAAVVRPQNTKSPRAENVTSLHQPADRQASTNSLYESADRHGSVNSLYEPFENV